jgi:Ca-activated chloride channel family protein
MPDLVPATEENILLARDYIRKNVNAGGLTNINEALMSSFDNTFSDSAVKIIAFLTDGLQSWGEIDSNKIIANVKKRDTIGVRVYTYGLGKEPSRFLLNGISNATGGYATFITMEDSIAVVVADQFKRMSKAALANIKLDYGALDVYDVYPRRLPDLFYGSQAIQLGRYHTPGLYNVSLSGDVLGTPFILTQPVQFGTTNNRSVSRLWASSKINFLLGEIDAAGERKELVDAVIDLSLRFQILTRYTAWYSDPNRDKASSINELASMVQWQQVYPNPAQDVASIRIRLSEEFAAQRLRVRVYSSLGELVATIADGIYSAGEQTFTWIISQNAEYISSGTYYVRIEGVDGAISIPLSVVR